MGNLEEKPETTLGLVDVHFQHPTRDHGVDLVGDLILIAHVSGEAAILVKQVHEQILGVFEGIVIILTRCLRPISPIKCTVRKLRSRTRSAVESVMAIN